MYIMGRWPIQRHVEPLSCRPALTSLNLIRVRRTTPLCATLSLQSYLAQRPTVRIRYRQSVIRALCHTVGGFSVFRARLGGLVDACIRVPDACWLVGQEDGQPMVDLDSQALWPFPVEQAVWLARYAPYLNSDRELLTAMNSDKFIRRINMDDGTRKHVFVCETHHEFCDHLDYTFYQDQLDGPVRNLIALLLLQQVTLPRPDPPPYPFQFECPRVTSCGDVQLFSFP